MQARGTFREAADAGADGGIPKLQQPAARMPHAGQKYDRSPSDLFHAFLGLPLDLACPLFPPSLPPILPSVYI